MITFSSPLLPHWRAICRTGLVLLVAVGLCFPRITYADSREDYIKAAFLYNFVKFIQWPYPLKKSKRQAPYVTLCIRGKDPFGYALEKIEEGNTNTAIFRVLREVELQEIRSCQMLFIGADEEGELPRILNAADNNPIVTISDIENFIHRGGMIGFAHYNERVKLEVNLRNIQKAKLEVDPLLLEVAMTVVR